MLIYYLRILEHQFCYRGNLLFQPLDTKKDCAGIYANGQIYNDDIPEGLTATWRYSPHLDLPSIEYANIYCAGQSISQVVPDTKREQWERLNGKLKAYIRACNIAKVDLDENCFFDIVPENFLFQYCEMRNYITKHVIENNKKPANYDFLLDLIRLLSKIKEQPLNLDLTPLSKLAALPRARLLYKRLLKKPKHYIEYDPFKSKTGRLTTAKSSFPMLTLDKNYRSILKPQNDFFVEFDFNAAELRTLLALSGKEQPEIDIHDWNVKNVYRNDLSREDAKKRIFAWLYNPNSKDYLSSREYDREEVLKRYYKDGKIVTEFDREILADDHHALNYIIQSTTSDLFLKRAIEVDKMLCNRKSNLAFLLHDSLVIDFSKSDTDLLNDIISTFAETDLGRYVTNISVGYNYGNMREYNK